MDRLGREYLPETLVEYYKSEKMSRNELLDIMETLPFLHRNGLIPFIEMLNVMYTDQGITPVEMRAHFTALVAHVSQGHSSPLPSSSRVTDQAVEPELVQERPVGAVVVPEAVESNTGVGRSTTPAQATGVRSKSKTNSLGS